MATNDGTRQILPTPEAVKPPQGHKDCAGPCGKILPATAKYFDRDSERDDGLKPICKECRAEGYRELKEKRLPNDLLEAVQAGEQLLVNQIVQSMAGSSGQKAALVPHIATVFESLMSRCNGPEGLADMFWTQYLASEAGSASRTKMLTAILSYSTKVSESGAADLPLDRMTEEQLEDELDKRVNARIARNLIEMKAAQSGVFEQRESNRQLQEQPQEEAINAS